MAMCQVKDVILNVMVTNPAKIRIGPQASVIRVGDKNIFISRSNLSTPNIRQDSDILNNIVKCQ